MGLENTARGAERVTSGGDGKTKEIILFAPKTWIDRQQDRQSYTNTHI